MPEHQNQITNLKTFVQRYTNLKFVYEQRAIAMEKTTINVMMPISVILKMTIKDVLPTLFTGRLEMTT